MLTVLENCRVSPPPATVGEKSLPLTFFDILWTTFFPIHQVFFYESSHSKQRFLETIVPNLKHSLSITLQHFFPFASNLIVFPNQTKKKPEIRHLEGDSVSVSFTECNLEFNDLTGNQPRNCDIFHPLVPPLGSAIKKSDYLIIPLFSVQVTLFPNSGIAIGLTNHHSLCDATTRFNFLKAWSSIAKHGTDDLFLASGALPLYDRVIKYPTSIDEFCLSLPVLAINDKFQTPHLVSDVNKVRATIVLTQAHINRLKKWASSQLPTLGYISSFSVACAYTWSCIAKSRVHIGEEIKKGDDDDNEDQERFICAVDWRSRLDPPIPQTYFGNCVGACITATTKTTLLASNKGFVTAVELFGKALKETLSKKNEVIVDVERWTKRAFEPVPTIGVSGTPKTKVYDVDFGWGKPKKHETISIDYNGSISVNACKDSSADIEIGVSLPAKQMDVFMSVHKDELESTYFAE